MEKLDTSRHFCFWHGSKWCHVDNARFRISLGVLLLFLCGMVYISNFFQTARGKGEE